MFVVTQRSYLLSRRSVQDTTYAKDKQREEHVDHLCQEAHQGEVDHLEKKIYPSFKISNN